MLQLFRRINAKPDILRYGISSFTFEYVRFIQMAAPNSFSLTGCPKSLYAILDKTLLWCFSSIYESLCRRHEQERTTQKAMETRITKG